MNLIFFNANALKFEEADCKFCLLFSILNLYRAEIFLFVPSPRQSLHDYDDYLFTLPATHCTYMFLRHLLKKSYNMGFGSVN